MINKYQVLNFCKEDISKIKNYDKAIADTTQTWECHHMTETWWNCSRQDLIDNECYYNRKACELIFLTKAEHRRLHYKGRALTEETRRKMSESHKGHSVSDESRRKISETKKGQPSPMKGKIHSEESLRKMSESHKGHPPTKGSKGMHWYNNGKVNKFSYECPEGYIKGRLK